MVESLTVDSLFEGHRTVQAEGRWGPPAPLAVDPGWFLVRTDQRLGVLAGYLLEPASEDGVVTWNLLDRELAADREYPIVRTRSPLKVAAKLIP